MRPHQIFIKTVSLAATLAVLSVFAYGETSVTVSPASTSVARNSQFTLSVEIAGVSNLQASQVQCSFDNTLVRFDNVTAGTFYPAPPSSEFLTHPAGGSGASQVEVHQSILAGDPLTGSGTLFTITFTAISGGTTSVSLTVSLRDPSNATISTTVTGSSVTVNNPLPVMTSISPTTTTSDDVAFTLTVNGSSFIPTSVVKWNGNARATTYVSENQLTAAILTSDLATVGAYPVTVFNPTPAGGTSVSADFTVTHGALHHFVIAAIASPQTAGTSFNANFTAQDAHNNTVTSFAGTVNLSTTAGTITPSTSAAFASGVRTEAVTVTQSGTDKTIVAHDGSGHTGTSNTFTVDPGALHHFALSAISTPQKTEVPISVTITAQDAYNNTVTGFTGTVAFSTTAGTISPATSGAFAAGQKTQNITVTGTGTARTVTATQTSGTKTGTSNPFDVILGPFTTLDVGLQQLWNSAAAWGDCDGDGDLDIAIMGMFTYTPYVNATDIYRNDGGTFTKLSGSMEGISEGTINWGDYDNDGDLDILQNGQRANGLSPTRASYIYNNASGTFSSITTGMQGIGSGSSRWGDYDNDGKLDVLLVGSNGTAADARLYRNTGTGFSPVTVPLSAAFGFAEWADYDNDGDLDILESGSNNSVYFVKLLQNANGTFSEVSSGLPGFGGLMDWGDYDGDGDLDLLLAGNLNGSQTTTRIYRNNTGTLVDINAGLTALISAGGGWGDYDNDGDLDILLVGNTGTEYVTMIYRNDSGVFNAIPLGLPGLRCAMGSAAWGDYDNDGDLDILVTGDPGSGGIAKIFRNNAGTANTPPSPPTTLSSTVSGTTVSLSWNAGSDTQTPAAGLTYAFRIGTTAGGCQIVSPMSSSTGYHSIPAAGVVNVNKSWSIKNLSPGKYYWSVQSIDNSFAGSAFAVEETFVIVGPLHHFTTATVSSPQLKDTPFDLGPITAKDANGYTVTDFSGTVDITSTGTLSAGGGTTGAFTSGVLASRSITFSALGTGITVTATRTGGSETGTSNTFNIVPANYTITSSAGAHGTISPTPSVSVAYTASQEFTMVPASGYHVGRLIVDGSDVNPAATYTFTNVIAEHSIEAYFAQDSYTVNAVGTHTIDANGDGTNDMSLDFTTLPQAGGTVNINVYRAAPAGAPAPPTGFIPCYVQITSTLPSNTFCTTVKLDMSLVGGCGTNTFVMHYNSTTSSWLPMPGTYSASDPLFSGHPSYQFTTGLFSDFAFVNLAATPADLLVSTVSNTAAAALIVPESSWGAPTAYEGTPPQDWQWKSTGTPPQFTVSLAPAATSVFHSCDVTLQWDAALVHYDGYSFGAPGDVHGLFASGQLYSPTSSIDYTSGQNRLTIHGSRGDANDFATSEGDYIAQLTFTLLKPGFSPLEIIGANFQKIKPEPASVYVMPRPGEVKAYICDVASAGSLEKGDGTIAFEDLSAWSFSYWSGVPGYAGGMTYYKMKYDFGPTQDGYVYTFPQYDGRIDFEDLVLFSISYGLASHHRLMKPAVPSQEPFQILLGSPVASGSDIRIPIVLEGTIHDVRGMSLEFSGRLGSFLGVERGEQLAKYAGPVPIMHRTENGLLFVDFAILGANIEGVGAPGEALILRFASTPQLGLTHAMARDSRNTPLAVQIVKGSAELVPTTFSLLQNYPNPFNPKAVISYQLPVASNVRLIIYDLLGREVSTLVNERMEPGAYEVTFDATGFASGVYFYRLTAGQFVETKKMIVAR